MGGGTGRYFYQLSRTSQVYALREVDEQLLD